MKARILSIAVLLIAGLMIVNAVAYDCCFYGLTPGYWKHWTGLPGGGPDRWPISTDTTFWSLGVSTSDHELTLLEALNFQGDGDMDKILLRAGAAAYLNALSSGTNYGNFAPGLIYPLNTDDVRYLLNTALASSDRGYKESVKNELELYNQLGG